MSSSLTFLFIFAIVVLVFLVLVLVIFWGGVIWAISAAVKSSKKNKDEDKAISIDSFERLETCSSYKKYDIVTDVREQNSRYIVVGEDVQFSNNNSLETEVIYQVKKMNKDEYLSIPIKYLRKVVK